MITFITGRPGSGKSLYAVTRGMEFVVEGRPVYALGIKGLNYEATGIKPYPWAPEGHDDPNVRNLVVKGTGGLERWMELESNAVLIVDEVQAFLKPRPTAAAVPEWIEAFTRNRHLGVDLLFLTQDPMLVDSYVRRVANYHEHFVRPEGDPAMSRRWKWSGVVDDVGKKGARSLNGEFALWRYPQQNYALYKSAEVHTVKFRLPQSLRFLIFGGAAMVLLAAVCVWGMTRLGKKDDPPPAAAAVAAEAPRPQVVAASPPADEKPKLPGLDFAVSSMDSATMTTRDYILRLIPRVDGMPVSAPIYDGVTPATIPEIYCISSADSCTCLSEQGTRVRVNDGVCRTIARDGSYNPYRRSSNAVRGTRG
jgi:zona occludens toxin